MPPALHCPPGLPVGYHTLLLHYSAVDLAAGFLRALPQWPPMMSTISVSSSRVRLRRPTDAHME